ncbi:MAG: hypothetical protein CL677_02220 [Bdellovibrionaceae bacterium]|nr:hypothetical protein [Pseudobdellovibrionaceae bacterium]|tara:strand:- start:79956 stop:81248 length:1293 start_codon:yes stop_codon:yes gene_type:complete
MALAIVGIGIMFFLGHLLSWVFEKTKIPDLLILVVIGYVMGPVLGILDGQDFGAVGAVISTLALIVILYEGGLHLSAKDLLTSSLPAAGLSFLSFGFSILIGIICGYGFATQDISTGILLGVGIGSTSSAIVIPMVKFLSIHPNMKTVLSLESAFTDVLTIVIFLVLVQSFAAGTFEAKNLIIGLGPNTLIAAAVGISSAFTWSLIKKRYSSALPNAFAGEAWALLTYGGLELAGLNGAIGVLTLGFSLANLNLLPQWTTKFINQSPVSFKEMSLLSEITYLLRTFFFIYLGILIQFNSMGTIFLALAICLLIFASRYLIIRMLFKTESNSRLDAMVATAMGPRGLACAVLATLPAQHGLAGGDFLRDTMFAIIPLSILFTALFVALSESPTMRAKISKFFTMYPEEKVLADNTKESLNTSSNSNPEPNT